MKRMTPVYTIAGLIMGALLSPAAADSRNWSNAPSYTGTTSTAPQTRSVQPSYGPVVEGRNAFVQQRTPMGVETYIARQIQRDGRGDN